MPVGHYQLFKFSCFRSSSQIVVSYYCHQLTSVRACHSPSHLVYWNGLWEQCLPIGLCPLVWMGTKALSTLVGMPVGHYQLFKFSLGSEAMLPDNRKVLLLTPTHSPSHLVYWNGFWVQCLPIGHCPLLWTGHKRDPAHGIIAQILIRISLS